MDGSGIFAAEARALGKSARTRARLMDAAVGVFARAGYEAASVNEIAQAAGVANGTFYLHFKDKDAIVAEVAFRIAGDIARQIDEALAGVEDAALRTSFATRQFIELAASQADWGWALVRAVWSLPQLRALVTTYLRADLERGVRQGLFDAPVDDLLVDVFASMVVGALMGRLRGENGPEAGPRTAELQLRMLGLSAGKARKVAWRELAPLQLVPAA